jgi:hypothetical protein
MREARATRTHAVALATAALLVAAVLAFAPGCSDDDGPTAPAGPTRSYHMGFSAIPPRNDFPTLLATLALWTARADGAILHISPPWTALVAGERADTLVANGPLGLANYYRSVGITTIVITLDATDGLNRAADAPELVALGRSLSEPAIQALYVEYATALDSVIRPTTLLLGAETNLIRAAAPAALYAGLRQASNDAASEVRARDAAVQLGVSVQVEVAWGLLGTTPPDPLVYAGVATDLADFSFAQAIGLSSYPYLGGFADPEDVPLDYYERVADEVARPVLLVEGGWPSMSAGGFTTTPGEEARWIRRVFPLLDRAHATGWYQLTFADFAGSVLGTQPPGSILPLFATLGLVDSNLVAKPALGAYDSVFARRRV